MFEVLCQGGCSGYSPVISLIYNLINLARFFGTVILLCAGLYNLIIQLLNKKKRSKKRTKKAIIEIIMAIIILLVIKLANVVYGTIKQDRWDNEAHCWCGK